jgi:hypothetical protein
LYWWRPPVLTSVGVAQLADQLDPRPDAELSVHTGAPSGWGNAPVGTTRPRGVSAVTLSGLPGAGPAYAGFVASTGDVPGSCVLLVWYLSAGRA